MANRLVINQKDRTLLMISQITKDYDWFYKLLLKNERITEELVEGLPQKQKDFIQDILPLVKQNATNEWKESTQPMLDSGENRDKWLKCRLCNTSTRYIHYIVNRHKNETINVGSECVKEYAFNDRDIRESRREALEIRRLTLLNENIQGINKIVENWKSDLDKYPILIPSNIANNYQRIGMEISDLFDQYLNGKVKENTVSKLKDLVQQGLLEKEKFELYVNTQESNPFKITRTIVNWLKKENNTEATQTLEWLDQDGVINYRTAHRIKEQNFMSLIKSLLQSKFSSLQGRVMGFDSFEGNYQIQFSPIDNVTLNTQHSELLQNFGWLLFDEEEFTSFTKINVLKTCKVNKSEKSIEGTLQGINMGLVNGPVKIAEYDYDFNEVYFYCNKRNYYIKDNLSTFVQKNFYLAYLSEHNHFKTLVDEVLHLKTKLSSSEFNSIKNRRNNQGVGNLISI